MFSQLSGWMQYLYVILFMMICGYGVPYLGGFNIFVFSLAAGSGALVLTKNTWLDAMLAHHQTVSFFVPLILLTVLAVLFVGFYIMGFALGMATVPDRAAEKTLAVLFGCAALLLALMPAYVPFHVIGVKGWLFAAGAAAFVVGAAVGLASLSLTGSLTGGHFFKQYFLQLLSYMVLSAGLYFMITKPAPFGLIWLGGFIIIAWIVVMFGFKNDIIATYQERKIINELIKTKQPVDEKTAQFLNYKLCLALKWDSMEKVNKLIRAGADINGICLEGSPLACALEWGGFNSGWGEKKRNKVYAERIKRAAFLLDKGANVNTPDVPLITAMDTPGAFNLLLEAGADVNAVNGWGKSALHAAAERDNAEYIKILLERGADINIQHREGYTPLMKAIYRENPETVKLLLDNGADLNIKNNDGDTVFDMYPTQEVEAVLEAYKK